MSTTRGLIESAATAHGWHIERQGHYSLNGYTLARRTETIWVELEPRRNRILRAARRTISGEVTEVHPADARKLDTVLEMIQS